MNVMDTDEDVCNHNPPKMQATVTDAQSEGQSLRARGRSYPLGWRGLSVHTFMPLMSYGSKAPPTRLSQGGILWPVPKVSNKITAPESSIQPVYMSESTMAGMLPRPIETQPGTAAAIVKVIVLVSLDTFQDAQYWPSGEMYRLGLGAEQHGPGSVQSAACAAESAACAAERSAAKIHTSTNSQKRAPKECHAPSAIVTELADSEIQPESKTRRRRTNGYR